LIVRGKKRDLKSWAAVLAVLSLIGTVGCLSSTGTPQGETEPALQQNTGATPGVPVMIEDFKFTPATITVPKGTAAVWTNKDSATHTTSALDGTWDSENLRKGDAFTYTFNEAGTFDYQCNIHPRMKGSVVVE
jgi:plastocyanin